MATGIWHRQWWKIGIAIAATSGNLLCRDSAIAQIVPDGTLGAERSVVTPNVDIKGLPSDRIDGGAIRGADLFHSFQEFNVGAGRGAYFSNPAGVENILSRVTGGNASNIFGKLGVLGNANLFLLNPNGIVFGPNASLDLKGSFVASTGNSLNLGNGTEFSATNPAAPPLLRVSVPLGVQFGQTQPKAIVNTGNLSVATGQNLTLLGGTVVSTGQLSALGGQVAVAAVPSGSVVNLSPSVQLLSIDSPSAVPGGDSSGNLSPSSAALVELLASSDRALNSGLTVSGNGQVELVGSGLPVVDGDVVARNVTAQTATLTANHNLTLVESQLSTTGDLNLLAGDTVRVRDSLANPFLAQAGGNLTIRGNKGIDILALNHPQTPFVSGGNLSLVSDGTISGDAHFTSGGDFSILNLSGSGGDFVSLYDPIIRSNRDVTLGTYIGASLKIESGGSITTRTIAINSPDVSAVGDPDSQTLTSSRALILRAGRDTLSGIIEEPNPLTGASRVNYSPSSSAGTLTINGDITSAKSADPLTVELQAKGDINAHNISSSGGAITIKSTTGAILITGQIASRANSGNAEPINVSANRDITINGEMRTLVARGQPGQVGDIILKSQTGSISTQNISSSAFTSKAGNISLTANGSITTGEVNSFIDFQGKGDGGSIFITSETGDIASNGSIRSLTPSGTGGKIQLNAPQGQIETTGQTITSRSKDGVAGDVTLKAAGDINSGNINASSNSNAGYSEIRLKSEKGAVFLDGVTLSTTNTGSGFAGDIIIKAPQNNVEIFNNSTLENTGYFGIISINAGGNVSIKNSTLNAITPSGSPQPNVDPRAGEISVSSSSGNIEINNSKLTTTTQSQFAQPGSIFLRAENGQVLIQENSKIQSTIAQNSGTTASDDSSPKIDIVGKSVEITGNSTVDASTSGRGNGANISVKAENTLTIQGDKSQVTASTGGLGTAGDVNITARSILLRGNGTSDAGNTDTGILARVDNNIRNGTAGNITITTDDLTLENARVSVTSQEGQAGNIVIFANKIFLDNSSLFAETGKSDAFRANIILLGNKTTDTERDNLISQIENDELGKQPLPGSPLQHLALRNESKINANANNNARGGNIAIKTEVLLAFPPIGQYGSDISANAQQGRGGVVALDSRPLGVYNIDFRTKLTPLNDITASSESGSAGIVTIELPDVDPRTGLIQLPEDLADSAKLIRQSCPLGGQQSANRFVVTGRGGLPPNPSSALSSDTLLGDADASTQSSNPSDQPRPTDSASDPPVEAQGVERGSKGEVILTAHPSTFTPYRPQPKVPGCDGK